MRARSRALGGVCALSIALLAGCGSTVSVSPGGPGQGAASGPTQAVVAGQPAGSPAPFGGAATAGATGTQPAPTAATSDGVGGSAEAGLGAHTQTIRVGFLMPSSDVVPDPTHTGRFMSTENFDAIVTAVVADLNRRGGIASRHVIAVTVDQPDELSYTTDQVATEEESECVQLTEDEKVFMVVAVGPVRYEAQCYKNHRTPLFVSTAGDSLSDRALRALAPWVIPNALPDLDTAARVLVAALAHQGFVNHRMGVIAPDDPRDADVVDHVLLPALAAAGGRLSSPNDVYRADDDLPHSGPEAHNAVLRWKTDNVQTVVVFDMLGAWGLLGQAADDERYHPGWGLDSEDSPQSLLDAGQPYGPPADQRDVAAAGWAPIVDVPESSYPLTTAERRCLSIVNTSLGTHYTARTAGKGGAAIVTCEAAWWVQQALAPAAGRPLVADQIAGLVARLGTAYRPISVPRAQFAPGKYDGLAVFRTVRYNAKCACMQYASPWLRAPRG